MHIQNVTLKIHFPVPKCLCKQGTTNVLNTTYDIFRISVCDVNFHSFIHSLHKTFLQKSLKIIVCNYLSCSRRFCLFFMRFEKPAVICKGQDNKTQTCLTSLNHYFLFIVAGASRCFLSHTLRYRLISLIVLINDDKITARSLLCTYILKFHNIFTQKYKIYEQKLQNKKSYR